MYMLDTLLTYIFRQPFGIWRREPPDLGATKWPVTAEPQSAVPPPRRRADDPPYRWPDRVETSRPG